MVAAFRMQIPVRSLVFTFRICRTSLYTRRACFFNNFADLAKRSADPPGKYDDVVDIGRTRAAIASIDAINKHLFGSFGFGSRILIE